MKGSNSAVIVRGIIQLCLLKQATSILCYDCNSAFDPRCGAEFDPFSLGVVNCSLRDPLDHIPDIEPNFCRSIKMEIYGKLRIVRQCGYIPDEKTDNSCRRQSGTGDLFVTYCSCDTDLCNSSAKHNGFFGVVIMFVIVCCLFG